MKHIATYEGHKIYRHLQGSVILFSILTANGYEGKKRGRRELEKWITERANASALP